MAFDTLNVALIGLAVLLLVIAVYRYRGSIPPPPAPKNPIGFHVDLGGSHMPRRLAFA